MLLSVQYVDAKIMPKTGISDVVQETLIAANRGIDRFHGSTERELVAWLRTILANKFNEVRRRYHTKKRNIRREQVLADDACRLIAQQVLDEKGTPSRHLIRKEEHQQLLSSINELPEKYARILRLRHLEGLSFRAIGKIMQKSEDAARKYWANAVDQLARVHKKNSMADPLK